MIAELYDILPTARPLRVVEGGAIWYSPSTILARGGSLARDVHRAIV